MAKISLKKAAERLLEKDNILILCHRYPDGDTIGSAFALCLALREAGKKVNVMCGDIIPAKYSYIYGTLTPQDMREKFIVAVDVASAEMLGLLEKDYGARVDLCIDHHGSNTGYAKEYFVDSKAAAAGEIIFRLIPMLGVEVTQPMATALYTAICTDTGCFRHSNVTPNTLRTAAKLMETGIDAYSVNRRMFETKTRERLAIERSAIEAMSYRKGGRIAVMPVTAKMLEDAGVSEGDIEGLSSMPRQIEGVQIGIMLREVKDGIKISVRSVPGIDASAICARLGGGGHPAAAGCFAKGASMEEAVDRIVEIAETALGE